MGQSDQNPVVEQVLERKTAFLAAFFVIFFLTYGLLYLVDFVPETPEEEEQPARLAAAPATEDEEREEVVQEVYDPYPERILIDSLDRDVRVLNPEGRSVAALDAALLEGVVRHPDSATLTETGTVFLFGHSSYLPKVYNRNFQAFNGLQKLAWGDVVRVQSSDAEYTYSVTRVYKTTATAAEVKLGGDGQRLVLVTCNSFGSKDDRFVVEAELVETRAL